MTNNSPGMIARRKRAQAILKDSLTYTRNLTAEQIADLLHSLERTQGLQPPRNGLTNRPNRPTKQNNTVPASVQP